MTEPVSCPIDLRTETLLSLSQAARRLPPTREGRPVTLSCVLRWITHGLSTPRGKVRLEAVRLGGRWLTSEEALQRFAAALTPDLSQVPPAPRPFAARKRASERAAADLEKRGF